MIDYITHHYRQPFRISDMNHELEISDSYARKILQKEIGMTAQEYLNHLRMFKAQWLLRNIDYTITRIADMTGYSNMRTFYRMYEKFYSVPCSYMRTLKKKGNGGNNGGRENNTEDDSREFFFTGEIGEKLREM